MRVYHGSVVVVKAPLVSVGRRNLDFGLGFYVTGLEEQAVSWASRPFNAGKTQILNVYEFDKEQALESGCRYLHFEKYDVEWLDFVIANRRGEMLWKDYDLVEGGIANDHVFNTLELYFSELIPKEEALKRLQYEKPNNQICILNQTLIDRFYILWKRLKYRRRTKMVENPLINETLLQMKYARVVSLLADTLGITQERALDLFYNSDTYDYLSRKMYHLHNMSDAYLVDEIMLELQEKQ